MLYNLEDTIAAISTPRGIGATGIIRISGPDAVSIAASLFSASGKKPLSKVASHSIVHGWVKDGLSAVDEVLVSVMLKPRTYTGEDTVEISAHAGPVILERILDLALKRGARAAGPGEFTFRAFTNGKLDLAEAEAVADLISSKTGLALDTALAHLKGRYSSKIHGFRDALVCLLASFEAALDHADEDIVFLSKDKARDALASLASDISELIKSSRKACFLREGVRASIIGKPNAGKSSLLNALLERERAIVTDIPGTTRDILEESVEIKGFPFVLFDTAGISHDPKDPVERIGQEKALEAIGSSHVLIWVFDTSTGITDADRYIYETIKDHLNGKTIVPAFNKSDLAPALGTNDITALLPPSIISAGTFHPVINISAKNGTGIPELEAALISPFSFSAVDGIVTANARHIAALSRVETALKETLAALDGGFSEEIPAMHLREALSFLGEITGETATEEILENIFKNFCVGK